MRLIDADALLDVFENKKADLREPFGNYYILGFSRDMAKAMVQRQPTIEAAPAVHGRWIPNDGMKRQVYCSVCGALESMQDFTYKSMYCPNCGANMDLKEDNHGKTH